MLVSGPNQAAFFVISVNLIYCLVFDYQSLWMSTNIAPIILTADRSFGNILTTYSSIFVIFKRE